MPRFRVLVQAAEMDHRLEVEVPAVLVWVAVAVAVVAFLAVVVVTTKELVLAPRGYLVQLL